ncbi:MAG TPA: ArsB/NhaD family transporter [Syntrophobacteraceae bacterium]|nr:ArsB/NhaD family transporter [Syntrophobacteraceae bacterium]
MKKNLLLLGLAAIAMVVWLPSVLSAQTPPAGPSDILIASGVVTNAQGKPVKEVQVHPLVNGKKLELKEEILTSQDGRYVLRLVLPPGTLPEAKISLEACKPAYANSGEIRLDRVVKEGEDHQGNQVYLANRDVKMARAVTPAFWIASLVLVGVYVLIALELMHRTLAAFLGASLLLVITYTAGTFNPDYVILTYEDAVRAIDMNVILLLMAMMIIVGVLKRTGVFQWMAYKSFQLARGNVFALSAVLMVVTAVTSAFLDNVTTMLLIIPVTIEIALTLKIDPVTLLMPEVFASNVGGTATLIGDPPNIMIGSYAKLSFLDFVQNLTFICVICLIFTVVYFLYWYRKEYARAKVGDVQALLKHLREEYRITDKTLLIQGGLILGVTVFLFIIHGALHMEPSIAAMIGAAVLLAVSRTNIVEILEHEIEWPTLIFFMMLFIVVAGAEETGLIQTIADWVNVVSQGSLVVAILMILWVSAVASAIVDNIPFTATMLPISAYLTTTIPGAEGGILWWALALGACLGGNGTMIGASANVVTVGMAERAGHPISFLHYMKVAVIPTIVTIVLASLWLLFVEI